MRRDLQREHENPGAFFPGTPLVQPADVRAIIKAAGGHADQTLRPRTSGPLFIKKGASAVPLDVAVG